MTQSEAQTVASALIGLGYQIYVQNSGTEYTVTAQGSAINPQAVANFAAAQGVMATVNRAKFT